MDNALRVRIKLGENEFEAEGSPDVVQTQIATFERLIGRSVEPVRAAIADSIPPIKNIVRADGKIVSLTVDCQSLPQAVLAMLLGHRELRGASWVSGSEIMAGLRASGKQIGRADNILKRHANLGHVVIHGKRRLKRYRLTTDGVERAKAIAQTLAGK